MIPHSWPIAPTKNALFPLVLVFLKLLWLFLLILFSSRKVFCSTLEDYSASGLSWTPFSASELSGRRAHAFLDIHRYLRISFQDWSHPFPPNRFLLQYSLWQWTSHPSSSSLNGKSGLVHDLFLTTLCPHLHIWLIAMSLCYVSIISSHCCHSGPSHQCLSPGPSWNPPKWLYSVHSCFPPIHPLHGTVSDLFTSDHVTALPKIPQLSISLGESLNSFLVCSGLQTTL